MLGKCLLVLFILFVFSLQPSVFSLVYGAPAYGTHMPEEKHYIWGVEGNFVLDRNVDNDEGGVSVNKYFLAGSYGVLPWLCLDGKIGIGNVQWDRTSGSELHYDTNFAGGYGFRIKGPEREKWGLKSVAGFQHISVHPRSKNQDDIKHQTIIDEWQGSFIISKDIGKFAPYLGVRYGTMDFIKWENEHDRKRIQSEKYCGGVVGLDIWLNKRLRANFEGDFIDGEEFAAGISYDF